MRIFISFVLGFEAMTLIFALISMATVTYPRRVEYSLGMDTATTIVRLALITWATLVLVL